MQIEDALEGSLATDFEMAKLWVPSEKISVQIIDVPTAPRRKWREIIPWMLEDIVLQNVSDIHYEIIDENSGKLTLLIISTECLENWQRIAKNAAVNAISMAPDYLAVPFDKNTIKLVAEKFEVIREEPSFVNLTSGGDGGTISKINPLVTSRKNNKF